MFNRPLIPTLLLLLFSLPLHAQSAGVENIRIGTSSDSVLALLPGTYTTIDTIHGNDRQPALTIMLAPVPLNGLDGLLVLDVDSAGSVTMYRWGIAPQSHLPNHGVWENFTGWKSWKTPNRKQTAEVSVGLINHYFPSDGINMTSPLESRSRQSLPDDGESPHIMEMRWQNEGTFISIKHDGTTLLVSVNRTGFEVEDR